MNTGSKASDSNKAQKWLLSLHNETQGSHESPKGRVLVWLKTVSYGQHMKNSCKHFCCSVEQGSPYGQLCL